MKLQSPFYAIVSLFFILLLVDCKSTNTQQKKYYYKNGQLERDQSSENGESIGEAKSYFEMEN